MLTRAFDTPFKVVAMVAGQAVGLGVFSLTERLGPSIFFLVALMSLLHALRFIALELTRCPQENAAETEEQQAERPEQAK